MIFYVRNFLTFSSSRHIIAHDRSLTWTLSTKWNFICNFFIHSTFDILLPIPFKRLPEVLISMNWQYHIIHKRRHSIMISLLKWCIGIILSITWTDRFTLIYPKMALILSQWFVLAWFLRISVWWKITKSKYITIIQSIRENVDHMLPKFSFYLLLIGSSAYSSQNWLCL